MSAAEPRLAPARLLVLAAAVEREGRYNVAKLLRAAAAAQIRREADELAAAAPRDAALLEALADTADAFASHPLLAPLAVPLRAGTAVFADGGIPLQDTVPDPRVCRRCGHVVCDAAPFEACPRCGADEATFLTQRPVWWLERHDPTTALAALATTPGKVGALLERVPEAARRSRPEPTSWSAHEVLAHLRDAQGVLEQRVGLILDHDDPSLEAQMVWSWNRDQRPAGTDEVLADYRASRQRVLERLHGVPAGAWWRTGRHTEFGRLTLTQQVSYFAAHETTHVRQVRAAAERFGRGG